MAWPGVAAYHIRHRMELKGIYELRCLDCSVTLLIHRESSGSVQQPPQWRGNPSQAPTPEGDRAGQAQG